jgi:hypothetical protein
MDRKDKRFVKGIVVTNVIVVVISIFLWTRFNSSIGVLLTVISIWSSFIALHIIINKYGAYEYRFANNYLIDRLLKKLLKW